MKEEEKAKAYDEAIKRLEDIKTGKCQKTFVFTEGLFDYIFPELREESEDERIVKELLTFFREGMHGGHILTNKEYDSWIAWLEKQGEQKPVFEMKTPEESLDINSDTYNKIVDDCIYGEQKSTWSEEDEKAINDIMWIIEAYRKNGFNETHIQMADSSEKWLKSLKERFTWEPSDEQMEALLKLEEMHVLEHENNKENAHLYMVVKSIREQLLKLREE